MLSPQCYMLSPPAFYMLKSSSCILHSSTTHRNTSEGGGFPAWGNVWFTGRCIQIIVRCSRHNDETKIQQEKPQQISYSFPAQLGEDKDSFN